MKGVGSVKSKKCKQCYCKKCINTCHCDTCSGPISECSKKQEFRQMSFFDKPKKPKLIRFFTWDDYGISIARYEELQKICQSRKYDDLARSLAYQANKDIAEYILLSVREDVSYDKFDLPKYKNKLGRICVCRTDFYGYRRLFYHMFDERIRENEQN